MINKNCKYFEHMTGYCLKYSELDPYYPMHSVLVSCDTIEKEIDFFRCDNKEYEEEYEVELNE